MINLREREKRMVNRENERNNANIKALHSHITSYNGWCDGLKGGLTVFISIAWGEIVDLVIGDSTKRGVIMTNMLGC